VQSVHDSAARVIAQPNGFVDDADWTQDGKALITNIYEKETGTFRLWRIPVNGGESESLGFGEAASGGVSTARQGPGLAFMRDNTDCNIWRIPGPASREGGATRLIASTRMDFFPRYSPDGRHIAFLSDRTGPERLWVCDAEGQNCSELPTRTRPFSPNWAPDGRQMVYVERDLGNRDIYVTSLDEAFPRPLVEWKSRDGFPAWSPDGRWIYFASDSTGRNEIWKVPAHGGKPEQVTRQGGTHTEVSEDGRFILYNRAREWNLLKVPVEGGDEVLVLEKYFRMQDSFKPWRNNVIFIDWSKRPYVLYLLDLNIGETTEITPLDDKDLCNGLSISPDGRWILYVNNEGTGVDIMFVENFP
jgi:Tol biopolymer transport system component